MKLEARSWKLEAGNWKYPASGFQPLASFISNRSPFPMKPNSPIQVQFLGCRPYKDALETMHDLRDRRLQNQISDQILFLEHPSVITRGRQHSWDDLIESPKQIKSKDIDLIETDRGGRLTYHGPGQLIIYFVMNIRERGLSIGDLVWRVEEGIRLYLDKIGICAERDSKNPGMWIGRKKIASLGFHVHRFVTTHGVSLNVHGDLTPFSYMIPCGLSGVHVTNILEEKGEKKDLWDVGRQLVKHYSRVFGSPRIVASR